MIEELATIAAKKILANRNKYSNYWLGCVMRKNNKINPQIAKSIILDRLKKIDLQML